LLAAAGTDRQNGHDFMLTRAGHGAGFWDRGCPKEIGEALTKACHRVRSEGHAYLCDDGRIYID
jgi:hypothetical protein